MMKLTLTKTTTNNVTDFTLKFGKYKGLLFSNTPEWYQDWLLAQDWFVVPPAPLNALGTAQKDFGDINNNENNTLTICMIN